VDILAEAAALPEESCVTEVACSYRSEVMVVVEVDEARMDLLENG
jgi:hypothetical protein